MDKIILSIQTGDKQDNGLQDDHFDGNNDWAAATSLLASSLPRHLAIISIELLTSPAMIPYITTSLLTMKKQ